MRDFLLRISLLAVLAAGIATSRAATDEALARLDGDVIGRIHFAGVGRIDADPAAVTLKQLGALPETAALREEVLRKLATTPFRVLKSKLASGTANDFEPLLRPLMDDLLHEEWYAEMRGPSDAVPEFMLAVHLNNNRVILWESSLSSVLATWTGIPVKQIKGDGFTGWELRKHVDPDLIRCLHVGDWLIFGWGQNELRLEPGFLQRIKTTKRPVEAFKDDWLDVAMDWPAFMRYHPFTPPAPLPAKLPKMHLTMQTRQDFIRPKLVMEFPEPLNLNLEPWKIPTELIRDPIASFSAARGIGPWLSQLAVVRQAQPPSVPGQMTAWTMGKSPFGLQVAMPVSNARNFLTQIEPRLAPAIDQLLAQSGLPGEAIWTNQELALKKVLFLAPYLSAVHEPSGDYLVGCLVRNPPPASETKFPAGLMNQINSKPNLVYYGWEINDEEIPQWLNLRNIYLMAKGKPLPPANSPGIKWISAARHRLGKCATEVTLTGPDELTLVRNAPIGLSAMEMTQMEYWVDAPGFPLQAQYPQMPQPSVPKPQSPR